jgi:hypothetical protein
VYEFLAASGVPLRRPKRFGRDHRDAPELLELLRVSVVPLLEPLSFGSIGTEQPLSGFKRSDDRALVLVTSSFRHWREETAPVLLRDPLIEEIRNLFEHVFYTGRQRSLGYATLRARVQTAIHFYFDLAALLGHHFLNPQAIESGSSIVRNSEPGYRAVTRWEMYAGLSWQGVPTETSALLSVSVTIDRLADLAAEPVAQDLWVLFRLISGLYEQTPSSQLALIQDQITSSLCPNLDRFIDNLSRSWRPVTTTMVTLAASLVEGCQGRSPMAARRQTRRAIVRWVLRGEGVQPECRPGVPAHAFLSREDLTWSLGLPESQKAEAARLLAEFTFSRIQWMAKESFRVMTPKNSFPSDAKALGRALGLAILHEVDLSPLRIHPHVVEILHPTFRVSIPTISHLVSAVFPASAEFVLMVAIGIEDVLGFGGFEMFSDEEWMALFGHNLGIAT